MLELSIIKIKVISLLKRTSFFSIIRSAVLNLSKEGRSLRRNERKLLKDLETRIGLELKQHVSYSKKIVIILGLSRVSAIASEVIIRKSFELAGYRCIVLLPDDRIVKKAYSLTGSDELIPYSEFLGSTENHSTRLLSLCSSVSNVVKIAVDRIGCGKFAVSTLMRKKRTGSLDFNDRKTHFELGNMLSVSFQNAHAAKKIINTLNPDALVLVDRGYSRSGELFDESINNQIPVFTWNSGHKNNTLILKKYTSKNKNVHPSSLSEENWNKLKEMKWEEKHWNILKSELDSCYKSGEWYSEVGTQVNNISFNKMQLIDILKLNPKLKTAIIYPHIFWDATFFWGDDLFENYEDWFIQTVKEAISNDKVNWIIKVHPANLVKDNRDKYFGKHSEIIAINKITDKLPDNIKVIPAETNISTYSLFDIMDYCLTVRGTIGIESACFGIPTITAGSGRYDNLGFTIDSNTREEYLSKIKNIEKNNKLTTKQTELARRYAFGVFIGRPTHLESIKISYKKNKTADLKVDFAFDTLEELFKSNDLDSISRWIESGDEDYFNNLL